MTEILKAHPEDQKWEKSLASESAKLDLPVFIFMRSNTWPGEIRRCGNQHSHPKWHYFELRWEREGTG